MLPLLRSVCSQTLKHCATHSNCKRPSVSSMLEFVMVAVGVGNQMPPHSHLEVSWWPLAIGASGISSAIWVGWAISSATSHQKLLRASYTSLTSALQCPHNMPRAACSLLKRFWAPRRESDINLSLSSTLHHFHKGMQCCIKGVEERISRGCSLKWSGRWMVYNVVLMIYLMNILTISDDRFNSM